MNLDFNGRANRFYNGMKMGKLMGNELEVNLENDLIITKNEFNI